MASKPFVIKASFKLPYQASIKLAQGQSADSAGRTFVQGVIAGSQKVEALLPAALNRSMQLPTWGPFSPKTAYLRKNGELATDGYRDLIDTGRLADSLRLKTDFLQTKTNINISYTAPYARLVYYGGVIQPYGNPNAASVVLPARPWIDPVFGGGFMGGVPLLNIDMIYREAIGEEWDNG